LPAKENTSLYRHAGPIPIYQFTEAKNAQGGFCCPL
jgi:hypothetical protein